MTTKEKLVQLKRLSADAKENIFERCRIAYEILNDLEFVAETYGDWDKALESIEDEFFSDIRGFIGLGRLRQVYEMFPDRKTWEQEKYNLAAMEGLWLEATAEKAEPKQRVDWKTKAKELELALEATAKDQEQEARQIKIATETCESLQQRVRELERENEHLRGRIEELEKQVTRQLVGA